MSWRIAAALFVSMLFAGLLRAQSEMATLRGVVTDSEGKPLAGVTVLVADYHTNVVVREVVTDSKGRYEAPYLKPGLYEVLIEESGYQTFTATGIRLEPGRTHRYDPKMVPGDPAQETKVTAQQPWFSPYGARVGATVDYKGRWLDAPYASRHPSALPLLTTAPAVQGDETALVISGISSGKQQTWALDGVPDDLSGEAGNPLVFDTAEVTIAHADVTASRPVNFNMVSKRAGESLHGMMFYTHSSPSFNARSFFDSSDASYRLREAGGEMGWDLIENWTWLFGSGMYQRLPYQQNFYADIPTEKMRNGDLSQYLDPQTAPNGKVVVVRDPRTGSPFPRNLVPANRINTVSSNYIKSYYPAPNFGSADTPVQNYTWLHRFGPDTYNGNWPLARWDQRVTNQHQFYLRWLQNQTASVVPGTVGRPLDATRTWRYRSLAFSDVHAFNSNLVNHFTVARARFRVKQGQSEADVDPPKGDSVVTTLALQGVNPQGFQAMGFPALRIAGLTGLAMAHGGGSQKDIARHDGFVALRESFTWWRGAHAVKAGVDYTSYDWLLGEVPQTVYGAFSFTGAYTGLAYADFLLGYPATSSRQTAKVPRSARQKQTGAYLADSWRLGSRLNVDFGVRWDYYGSPTYDDGYMTNWDPSTGNLVVAPGTYTAVSAYYPKNIAITVGRTAPKPNTKNVRPRLGAAFRLSDSAVVRAGYGEFTESPGLGPDGRLNPTHPYWLKETYTNWVPTNIPALAFPRPFPTTPTAAMLPGQSVTALPFRTEEGVIRQFNLTLEHGLGALGWSLSYVGFRGLHMNYALDINKPRASATPFAVSRRPYPQFASATVIRNDGRWHYDSLVARVRNRRGPLLLDSAFTWANNISNYANTFDPYNVTSQWTRDGATRRLYSVTTVAWPLPVGRGRRLLGKAGPLVNFAVNHWTLHAVGTLASGQYFSPWFTGPDPANASPGFVTALPDCLGNPKAGAGSKNLWFNPAAFAVPPANAGRYGTCGMNVLEGYPVHVAHLGLAKVLPLGESLRAVFTVQVSNAANTPHFSFPNSNITNPNPGVFTASAAITDRNPIHQGPRQINLRLRLEW